MSTTEEFIKQMYELHKPVSPERNPLTFCYHPDYKEGMLGDKGKIYLFNKKVDDCGSYFLHKNQWVVPSVWKTPPGFRTQVCLGANTKSEYIAREHYRYSRKALNKLKKKWDSIIEKEDVIYNLSKAKDSAIELKLKDGFKLRPHQKAVVEFCQTTSYNPLIALDMRMGKSYGALAYIYTVPNDRCLLVVPANLISTWVNFINTIFENPTINVLKRNGVVVAGYNIVSYNVIETIDATNLDVCVLDEAHYIKNLDTIRSKGVMGLDAKVKIALTGTPFSNKSKEVLALLRWLNPDLFNDEWQCNNYYLFHNEQVIETELLEKILRRTCMVRLLTHEVVEIGEIFTNFIPLTSIDPTLGRQELGLKKVPYAVQYANTHDEKLIICTYHKKVAEQIAFSLGDRAVLRTGETPNRDGILSQFRDDKQILVATSDSIKLGLDISFANRMLFVEGGYSLEILQTMARVIHNDKKDWVVLDFLEVPGSIDTKMYGILKSKINELALLG